MEVKVLGPGCANCQVLEENVQAALSELGLDGKVEKVTDYAEIVAYGLMSTPGLVVDGKVVVSGRVPSKDEIKEILKRQ